METEAVPTQNEVAQVPKLNDDVAAKVEQAEDGFAPVPEGVYILQLMEDVTVHEGDKAPYWRWQFEVPKEHDGVELERAGRRFWTNTSTSDAAYFKLKETFGAFGVPTNTDTEELVGRRVKAEIIIKTIQGGQRKGDLGNEIAKLHPIDWATSDEDDHTPATGKVSTAKAKGGSSEDPLF